MRLWRIDVGTMEPVNVQACLPGICDEVNTVPLELFLEKQWLSSTMQSQAEIDLLLHTLIWLRSTTSSK